MKKEINGSDPIEIDLFQLIGVLWHRAWAILLTAILFGGAAFSYAFFVATPMYQASALMYVNNSSISVGSTTVSLADLSASQSLVETYLVIMKTRLTLEEVIQRAKLNYSYEDLKEMISASAVNETEIFQINVKSPDPVEAEVIANTLVEVLPDKIEEIMDGSSVRAVDYAVVPTQRSSPNITRYTALGLILGFIISCGVIVLLELLDDQVHNEDYLTQMYGLPVLAGIPDFSSQKTQGKYGGYYVGKKGNG